MLWDLRRGGTQNRAQEAGVQAGALQEGTAKPGKGTESVTDMGQGTESRCGVPGDLGRLHAGALEILVVTV